jgi:DNA repair exonuclease SbcCD ATPase subunit
VSALKSEHTAVTLSIDNEIAEINVLEPQLAECHEEERAFTNAVDAKKNQNRDLEKELAKKRFQLADAEKRNKELNDELESMRTKLNKLALLGDEASSSSRRPIVPSELPKSVSFMVSDSRKLSEMEKDKSYLESQIATMKQKLSNITKKIKEIAATSGGDIAASSRTIDFRKQGFVPIDGINSKRKREEEIFRELDARKPTLGGAVTDTKPLANQNNLDSLALLVSLLSDNEEVPEATDDVLFDMPTQQPDIIVLD